MNLGQLRGAAREMLRDHVEPFFFSDTTLDARLNEAEREACIRAKLIYDAAFSVALIAEQSTYDLAATAAGSRFFLFDHFSLGGAHTFRTLLPSTEHQMSMRRAGWEDADSGAPEVVLLDQAPRKIRLWPAPDSDFAGVSLRLRGFRLPLADMTANTDAPEIEPIWHEPLLDWVLYRCYATNEWDVYDPARSERHLAAFERRFGVRPSADLHALMSRREYVPVAPRFMFGGGGW